MDNIPVVGDSSEILSKNYLGSFPTIKTIGEWERHIPFEDIPMGGIVSVISGAPVKKPEIIKEVSRELWLALARKANYDDSGIKAITELEREAEEYSPQRLADSILNIESYVTMLDTVNNIASRYLSTKNNPHFLKSLQEEYMTENEFKELGIDICLRIRDLRDMASPVMQEKYGIRKDLRNGLTDAYAALKPRAEKHLEELKKYLGQKYDDMFHDKAA